MENSTLCLQQLFKDSYKDLTIVYSNDCYRLLPDLKILQPIILFNINFTLISFFKTQSIWSNYLIYAENLKEFNTIMKLISSSILWHSSESPRSKYNVIISKKEEEVKDEKTYKEQHDQIQKIKQNLFELDVIDIKIFFQNCSGVPKINPTMANRSFKAVLWDEMFSFPYFSKDNKNDLMTTTIKFIAEVVKLNLKIVKPPLEEQIKLLNKSYYLEKIKNKTMDVLVPHVDMSPKTYNHYDHTNVFFYDPYYWIVPLVRSISYTKVITSTLSPNLIIAVIFILILHLILKKITNNVRNLNIIEQLIRLTFLQTIIRWPKTYSRFLLLAYLIFSMQNSYIYQSKLVSFFAFPFYEKGPRNLKDLVRYKIPILNHVYVLESLKLAEENNIVKPLINQSIPTHLEGKSRLKMVALYGNVSTTVMESYLNTFTKYRRNVRIMNRRYLLPISARLALRRGHPLFQIINDAVRRIVEGGFYKKWLRDLNLIEFEKSKKKTLKICYEHLRWPFIALFFGWCIAFVIFALEILLTKTKYLK